MAAYLDNDEAVAHPRFDTVNRVCEALGVRLIAVPKGAVAQPRQG